MKRTQIRGSTLFVAQTPAMPHSEETTAPKTLAAHPYILQKAVLVGNVPQIQAHIEG